MAGPPIYQIPLKFLEPHTFGIRHRVFSCSYAQYLCYKKKLGLNVSTHMEGYSQHLGTSTLLRHNFASLAAGHRAVSGRTGKMRCAILQFVACTGWNSGRFEFGSAIAAIANSIWFYNALYVWPKKKSINLEFSYGQIFVSGNTGFVRFVRSYRPGYRYWKNTGYIVFLPGLLVPGWAGQNFLCSQSDVMKKISRSWTCQQRNRRWSPDND